MLVVAGPSRVASVLVEIAVVSALEKAGREVAHHHRAKRTAKQVEGTVRRHRAAALLGAVATALAEIAVDELVVQRRRMSAAIDRAADSHSLPVSGARTPATVRLVPRDTASTS